MIAVDGISHIGIAVPDLEAAADFFAERFGCRAGAPIDVPAQGLRLAYIDLGPVRIELLTPTAPDSGLARFLERNPRGGLHHLALSVPDAEAAYEGCRQAGLTALGDGPQPGHHGRPIFFIHPKDVFGALVEIEQRAQAAPRPEGTAASTQRQEERP